MNFEVICQMNEIMYRINNLELIENTRKSKYLFVAQLNKLGITMGSEFYQV